MNKDLEFALKHCRQEKTGHFPDVFPIDFGVDIKLELKERPNVRTQIFVSYGETKRTVKLKISTFRGICGEAIHYYGDLFADGIQLLEDVIDENTGKHHTYCIGGYIGKEFQERSDKHLFDDWYQFELVREVTQEEIDKYPDRFEFYSAGDMVNCFYTKKDIIELAKKIVEVRFPGWNFKIEER